MRGSRFFCFLEVLRHFCTTLLCLLHILSWLKTTIGDSMIAYISFNIFSRVGIQDNLTPCRIILNCLPQLSQYSIYQWIIDLRQVSVFSPRDFRIRSQRSTPWVLEYPYRRGTSVQHSHLDQCHWFSLIHNDMVVEKYMIFSSSWTVLQIIWIEIFWKCLN